MSRYIDADVLRKNEIARCHCVPCVGSNDNNYKDLDEVLNDTPTADVVEVVRCKGCCYMYYISENHPCCALHDFGVTLQDFCSWGERREDDEVQE